MSRHHNSGAPGVQFLQQVQKIPDIMNFKNMSIKKSLIVGFGTTILVSLASWY